MTDDLVVTGMRARRDKFAAECGYDVAECGYVVKEVFRRIQQRQAESSVAYVSYTPQRMAHRRHAAGPLSEDDAKRDDHGA